MPSKLMSEETSRKLSDAFARRQAVIEAAVWFAQVEHTSELRREAHRRLLDAVHAYKPEYFPAPKKRREKPICAGCGFAHAKDYKDCVWLKNPY